jgi:murein L,D-transpeptidase YafK
MKKRRRYRGFILLFVFLLLLVAGGYFLFNAAATPPLETINRCQLALSKARSSEAELYARDLLMDGENDWRDAMLEWKIQNIKGYFSRDYTLLNRLVKQASAKAEAAYKKSIAVKDSLHHDLAIVLAGVEDKLTEYEKQYSALPLNRQSRQDYQTAKMLYLEAREAYERGNYNRVGPKAEKSRTLIRSSIRQNYGMLRSYFSNVSKWRQWANETIEWSKTNNKTAIVVDKFARKCYLYSQGAILRTFNAELGINWIGGKKHKGDKATPEGKYYITKKKSKKGTKYYKALLINYPNETDKARFAEEVRKGLISRRASIGGLIEIHGGGGQGINWTDGCVALTNGDMDNIFDLTEVGTPVTIIGSLKHYEEVGEL